MEFVDYTGKLNDHNQYLQVIKQLQSKCKYIEYAVIDKDDKKFTEQFEYLVISVSRQKQWWGTKSAQSASVCRLKVSKDVFKYLKQFETFCKYITLQNGRNTEARAERTDFGINDIAFFDDTKTPLLFTTTHEGYIWVREDFAELIANSDEVSL